MSLLVCCTGGKRQRRHKASSKSCPPVERHQHIGDITERPAVPDGTDSTHTRQVLSSFRSSDRSSIARQETLLTYSSDATSLHRDVSHTSNGELSGDDSDAGTTNSDETHASLDHILAHLLNDISSPSFQRTSHGTDNGKTDENMNIHDLVVPDVDVNSTSSTRVFSFEENSVDDYDIPCGESDDGVTQQSDYDFPPPPVSCPRTSDDVAPTLNVRKKDISPVTETEDQTTHDVDYDTPRRFRDVDDDDNDTGSHHSAPASHVATVNGTLESTEQSAVDVTSTEIGTHTDSAISTRVPDHAVAELSKTSHPVPALLPENMSNSFDESCHQSLSARSSCEIRLTLIEQFKAVRLEVLTSMSHLLQSVGCPDHTIDVRIANITKQCSTLKTSLLKFIGFVQVLIDKSPQTDIATSTQITILHSVHSRIDEYLEGVNTIRAEDINDVGAKLAGIIRITKDIPALLRTFAPLVELAVVQAEEKISQSDNGSAKSLKVTADNRDEDKVEESGKIQSRRDCDEHPVGSSDDSMNSSSNSDTNLVTGLRHFGNSSTPDGANESDDRLLVNNCNESSDVDLPSLPPKQKHRRSFDNVIDSQTYLISATRCGSDEYQNYGSDASLSHSSGISEKLVSISQTDLSNVGLDSRPHYEPVMRRKTVDERLGLAEQTDQISHESEFETPDVRASGVSQTTADQLEELRRQADSQFVHVHTDYTLFNELDTTVSLSVNQLSDNDRRLLMFYCNQMANNWSVLDHAAGAFFNCMERQQSPKVFVMQSKFVILAGHKMTYIGDILAKNIEDDSAQDYIVSYSNKLCSSLKMAVMATKEAALKFPDIPKQQMMVDCIKDVTDWAIELKELVDRLTYIGQAEQLLA